MQHYLPVIRKINKYLAGDVTSDTTKFPSSFIRKVYGNLISDLQKLEVEASSNSNKDLVNLL